MKKAAFRVAEYRPVYFTTLLLGSLFVLGACGHDRARSDEKAATSAEFACKDGVDNDGDGRADCDDVDCQSPGGECNAVPALDRTVASTLA